MKFRKVEDLNGIVIFTFDEHKVVFGEENFSKIDLENANLQGIIWQDVKLCGTNLKNADFYGANLFMSDLSEANCENAIFAGTALEEVNFNKANLRNAFFRKDNLGGVNSLEGVNFSETNLSETIFEPECACYDENTIFPDDFNPEEKKLKFVKK